MSEEEEAALLAVASPHLRSMIIAALDTGMRRGEMLALRFGDIDWKRRAIAVHLRSLECARASVDILRTLIARARQSLTGERLSHGRRMACHP